MISGHTSAICPYCKVHVTFSWTEPGDRGGTVRTYLSSFFENDKNIWVIGECPSCENCILINGEVDTYDQWITRKIFPYPLPSPVDERIPSLIKKDLEEAKLCFSVGAYNASASMSRRALQRACKEKGATKKDLIDQIDELATKGIITADLKELAQAVRIFGNDGAHPNDFDVDELESNEVLELAEQFMEVIFVAPKRVKEMKDKRTQKKTETNKPIGGQ